MSAPIKILISFHIAPDLIEKIKQVDPNIKILYDPSLLGKPRYINDQHGAPIQRTSEQEEIFRQMMSEAEILFGYVPRGYSDDLKSHFPLLKWNQSPSAGIGWGVYKRGWTETDIEFTTNSGTHSTPLAEFCLMSMLMFVKDYFLMAKQKERHHWQRTCTTELRGKTLGVVGLGRVGKEIARLGQCFGMRVVGNKRHVDGVDPKTCNVDKLYSINELNLMLSESDFVVLICPETEETRGLMGEEELASMKKGSVLINIARGSIVEEEALIRLLKSGHLGGAALDVASKEPLPPESPLWDMPNVIISPHSASTADSENEKLTEIFVDNLHRYLNGKPFRNLLDKKLLY
ncbi:MAG: D-2-hydroxyacid dehydrogenase [Candidatus Bathyarchaeota archaeon]|nr:D-2-hydroxyacid dehydrogenase [Candidatus Bathyarchaeota archaeon]